MYFMVGAQSSIDPTPLVSWTYFLAVSQSKLMKSEEKKIIRFFPKFNFNKYLPLYSFKRLRCKYFANLPSRQMLYFAH